MKIIKNIKQLRQVLGWRQYQLADYAHLSQAMISKYENGHIIPTWNRDIFTDLARSAGFKTSFKG